MDSFTRKDKYFLKKITCEEMKNDYLSHCKANQIRKNLILNFFSSLEGLEISRRLKERSIIMFDIIYNKLSTESSNLSDTNYTNYFQLFLLASLNISLKLEDGNDNSVKIMKKYLLNYEMKFNQSKEVNHKLLCNIKLFDIYSTELYILNMMEWKIELTIFTEFTDFFIFNYFEKLFNLFEKEDILTEKKIDDKINYKEKFILYVNFFTECSLIAFNLSYVPKHTISLLIILLSLDQIKPFIFNSINNSLESVYFEKFNKKLTNILIDIKEKYEVDFLRVYNYKILLLNFLEENKVKVIKNNENKENDQLKNLNENLKFYFVKTKNLKFKNLQKKYSSNENFSNFDKENILNLNLKNSNYFSNSKYNSEIIFLSSSKYSPCRKIFKLEHNYCVNNLYFEKNYYSQNTENMKLRKTKFKEDYNTTNI